MAEIFISYGHQDSARASSIASVLERQGWSVWWDPAIRSGESFVSVINREIGAASCVVVLWSKASVVSRWVLEEANNGLNRRILCPVVIDRDVQLPVGFATIKYISLWDWQDVVPVGGYGPLFKELTQIVGAPARAAPLSTPVPTAAMPQQTEATAPPRTETATRQHTETTAPSRTEAATPQHTETTAAPGTKAAAPQHTVTTAPPRTETAALPTPIGGPSSAEDRFIDFTDVRWLDYPVMALFLAPLALVLGQFVSRFVLSQPLPWSEEFVSTAGVAGLFGAAVALRNNRSIHSPAALLLLPSSVRSRLVPVQTLISSGLFSIMAYGLFVLPRPPVRFAIAIAFALMAFFSLSAFTHAVVGKDRS